MATLLTPTFSTSFVGDAATATIGSSTDGLPLTLEAVSVVATFVPINQVKDLVDFSWDVSSGDVSDINAVFQWSTDGITYTSTETLSSVNLAAQSLDANDLFYFRLFFNNLDPGTPIVIDGFTLTYTADFAASVPGLITNTTIISDGRVFLPYLIGNHIQQINGGDGYDVKLGNLISCDPKKGAKPIIYIYNILPTDKVEQNFCEYEMGMAARLGVVSYDSDNYLIEDQFCTMFAMFNEFDEQLGTYSGTFKGVTFSNAQLADFGVVRVESSSMIDTSNPTKCTRGYEFEVRLYFNFKTTGAKF